MEMVLLPLNNIQIKQSFLNVLVKFSVGCKN
jgi:hypothetical protein